MVNLATVAPANLPVRSLSKAVAWEGSDGQLYATVPLNGPAETILVPAHLTVDHGLMYAAVDLNRVLGRHEGHDHTGAALAAGFAVAVAE